MDIQTKFKSSLVIDQIASLNRRQLMFVQHAIRVYQIPIWLNENLLVLIFVTLRLAVGQYFHEAATYERKPVFGVSD